MTEAWLHRRGKPTWHFTPSARYCGLRHITRRGTVYIIRSEFPQGETFWIATTTWANVTSQIRAHSIEFADGGVYTFPGKR